MTTLHIPTDDGGALIVTFDQQGRIFNTCMMQPRKRVVKVPYDSLTPQQQNLISNAIIVELDEQRYES